MEAWNRWLQRFFPGNHKKDGAGPDEAAMDRGRKNRLLIMLIGLGALILVLGRLDPPGTNPPSADGLPAIVPLLSQADDAATTLEKRLERILGEIAGAGKVEVMVQLEGTERHVYARQTTEEESVTREVDSNGAVTETRQEMRRSDQPVFRQGGQGRNEEALIETIFAPEVRGVLVIAEGASNEVIRYQLAQAVQTVLGVAAHRVEVLPKRR